MAETIMFGGSGLLGTELQKTYKDIIYLDSQDCNIENEYQVNQIFMYYKPVNVIHAAAFTNSTLVDLYPKKVINTNIVGTANIAKECYSRNIRLSYISTDYVYQGTGNHRETDPVYPANDYAWTKLAGETMVKLVKNHCIIRTSFGSTDFPYTHAYANLYTSKDYVDIIAPMIMNVVQSKYIGVINVGTSRKSVYEYARRRNSNVKASAIPLLKDYSLNTDIYEELCRNR